MTALNEARHLDASVRSVLEQDYTGGMELVVAVGPSADDTLDIARDLAAAHPHMRVVVNPTGRTPAGLNLAIAATDPNTPIIVRTDGHARLPRDYVRCAVETLEATGAANVGGMMIPEGSTSFEDAVARAMSSRIGLGPAPFHVGGAPGPADSVYLGVFRRSALTEVGGFDEHYVRAQDWELNYRIRRNGGVVWFDPRLRVGYRPRPDVRRLARQFHLSGMWRWQIIERRPDTVSVRYLAAPVATLALGLSAVLTAGSAVGSAVGSGIGTAGGSGRSGSAGASGIGRALRLGRRLVPAGYVGVIAVGTVVTRRGLGLRASLVYPVVLVTMHLSWGSGFLRAAAGTAARRVRRVRRHGLGGAGTHPAGAG